MITGIRHPPLRKETAATGASFLAASTATGRPDNRNQDIHGSPGCCQACSGLLFTIINYNHYHFNAFFTAIYAAASTALIRLLRAFIRAMASHFATLVETHCPPPWNDITGTLASSSVDKLKKIKTFEKLTTIVSVQPCFSS